MPNTIDSGRNSFTDPNMANNENDWFTLSMRCWTMGSEAAMVVWLRSMRIAMGGAAADSETRRMVEEKMTAAMLLGTGLMTGKLGSSPEAIAGRTIDFYDRRVRANRKRLSRSLSTSPR